MIMPSLVFSSMLDLFYGHIFVAYGYLYKKEKSRPKVILFLYIQYPHLYTHHLLKECLIDKRGEHC